MRKIILILSLLVGLTACNDTKNSKEINSLESNVIEERFIVEQHKATLGYTMFLIKDTKTNKEFLYLNKAMVEIVKDNKEQRVKQQNSFKKEINSLLEEIDSKYKSLEKELYNPNVSYEFTARVCVGLTVLSIRKDIKKLKKVIKECKYGK